MSGDPSAAPSAALGGKPTGRSLGVKASPFVPI
jgi:hypothetical protein